jgi:carboxyvinyl-carboxyphosphonate phosphorylmutase
MSEHDPRQRLRTILAGERCVRMASIFDPISARIADDIGAEAGLMGGSLVSHVVLGAPDLILLTLSELAEQVHRCTRASSVPIVVDADHGYGNALNVMRTVQELDTAGAGAVMIEDTLLPRAFGAGEVPQLLSVEESVGKMRAAVAARGDSDLVVLGRTGAANVTSVDDAIRRFEAYEAAGVDALFLPGIGSREDLERIATAVRLPLVLGGAPTALSDPAVLASRKVRLWSAGHQVFAVAVNALYRSMKAVHEGTPPATLDGIASKEIMDCVTGARAYAEAVQRFLDDETRQA